MEILVIRFSSMGDVICATPLFSFLKKKYPAASITFVTDTRYSGLFADDPRLTQVVGVGRENLRKVPVVSSGPWDLIVDIQNNRRSRTMLAHTRDVKMRGRFDKLHRERLLLLLFRTSLYPQNQNIITRYIKAAGHTVSIRDLEPPRLFFGDAAKKRAHTALAIKGGWTRRPTIALFPFSAWKNKEWPREYFCEVGRYFCSRDWDVLIMGGQEDEGAAKKMRESIGGRSIALAGALSLTECGALLTGCRLALGNDTGLTHLARASGVKTGVIYGPTTRHLGFYPYGEPAFRVFEEKLFCRPCHAHGGNVCLRINRNCMKKISVGRVIDGLEELDSMI